MKLQLLLEDKQFKKYINEEAAISYLETFCKTSWEAFKNGHAFYRGDNETSDKAVIWDLENSSRSSKETSDFYNIFLRDSDLTKHFHDRKKSLIFSSNYSEIANEYGKSLSLVFPIDGAIISSTEGVGDMWSIKIETRIGSGSLKAVIDGVLNKLENIYHDIETEFLELTEFTENYSAFDMKMQKTVEFLKLLFKHKDDILKSDNKRILKTCSILFHAYDSYEEMQDDFASACKISLKNLNVSDVSDIHKQQRELWTGDTVLTLPLVLILKIILRFNLVNKYEEFIKTVMRKIVNTQPDFLINLIENNSELRDDELVLNSEFLKLFENNNKIYADFSSYVSICAEHKYIKSIVFCVLKTSSIVSKIFSSSYRELTKCLSLIPLKQLIDILSKSDGAIPAKAVAISYLFKKILVDENKTTTELVNQLNNNDLLSVFEILDRHDLYRCFELYESQRIDFNEVKQTCKAVLNMLDMDYDISAKLILTSTLRACTQHLGQDEYDELKEIFKDRQNVFNEVVNDVVVKTKFTIAIGK